MINTPLWGCLEINTALGFSLCCICILIYPLVLYLYLNIPPCAVFFIIVFMLEYVTLQLVWISPFANIFANHQLQNALTYGIQSWINCLFAYYVCSTFSVLVNIISEHNLLRFENCNHICNVCLLTLCKYHCTIFVAM